MDDDGNRDLVSGSYRPGDVYFWLGRPSGDFSAGEVLTLASGDKLRATRRDLPDDELAAAATATTPWFVDLDSDGDLDLLVGNIGGEVIEFANIGSKTKPAFEFVGALAAAGERVQVHSDAGPEVVDWNDDGLPDLLLGSGDGEVLLYRGVETAGAKLAFGGREVLIACRGEQPHIWRQGTPDRPAARAKTHAVDWDLDGNLDLVVGDYAVQPRERRRLSEQESTQRDAARARLDALREQETALSDSIDHVAKREQLEALIAEQAAEVERLRSGGYRSIHGIWVYLRHAR